MDKTAMKMAFLLVSSSLLTVFAIDSFTTISLLEQDMSGASLICLDLCKQKFEYRVNNSQLYSKYASLTNKFGHHLRNTLLNIAASTELQRYCRDAVDPFLTCLERCSQSWPKQIILAKYGSISSLCSRDAEDFLKSISCLNERMKDMQPRTCKYRRRKHAAWLNRVTKFITTAFVKGTVYNVSRVHDDLDEFCGSLEAFVHCQRPLYVDACGLPAFESELSTIYFAVYRSAATLATLVDADFRHPHGCQWIDDEDGGENESVAEMRGSEMASTWHQSNALEMTTTAAKQFSLNSYDKSTCSGSCYDILQNFTSRQNLTRFLIIDSLNGIDLRRFLRISYAEELKDYCQSIYDRYVQCMDLCPTQPNNILNYTQTPLYLICRDHPKTFSESLQCLKTFEEASDTTCFKKAQILKSSFDQLDSTVSRKYVLPDRIMNLSEDYCPKLKDLIRCEHSFLVDECGLHVAELHEQIQLMFIDKINYRLIQSDPHLKLPDSCSPEMLSASSSGTKLLIGFPGLKLNTLSRFSTLYYIIILTITIFYLF